LACFFTISIKSCIKLFVFSDCFFISSLNSLLLLIRFSSQILVCSCWSNIFLWSSETNTLCSNKAFFSSLFSFSKTGSSFSFLRIGASEVWIFNSVNHLKYGFSECTLEEIMLEASRYIGVFDKYILLFSRVLLSSISSMFTVTPLNHCWRSSKALSWASKDSLWSSHIMYSTMFLREVHSLT